MDYYKFHGIQAVLQNTKIWYLPNPDRFKDLNLRSKFIVAKGCVLLYQGPLCNEIGTRSSYTYLTFFFDEIAI